VRDVVFDFVVEDVTDNDFVRLKFQLTVKLPLNAEVCESVKDRE
jgi:hypothetical protein